MGAPDWSFSHIALACPFVLSTCTLFSGLIFRFFCAQKGESQKIVHLLTEFQSAYVEQNPARVKAQFQNPDSVMILAYAIVMLHTDLYSPSIRPQAKMTGQEFVKNLRGIDDGECRR
ncbi:unnamed protein product [Dibothriocephalus latus]|uniref:SEC7 domain-containing protein n=1 Tax=Dibothriocephalus latus TaxID=60516 RepID=A0A3P7NU27_DIBLA|nr:unnamed protein product [Dibothriocephalus latus]